MIKTYVEFGFKQIISEKIFSNISFCLLSNFDIFEFSISFIDVYGKKE